MKMQRKCKERNWNCNEKCQDNYGNAEKSARNAIGIATGSAGTKKCNGKRWNNYGNVEKVQGKASQLQRKNKATMEMHRKCKERHPNSDGKRWDNYGNAEKEQVKASELQRKTLRQLSKLRDSAGKCIGIASEASGQICKCRESERKGISTATESAGTTMELQRKC